MAVELPNVQQPFVEPNTGLVNRTWYLALLGLNNQVQPNVVVSVNISGNNGIQASGGPITSSGVISLFIGNLTCTNILTTGTVTAANAVIVGAVVAGNANVSGTVTTANAIVTGKVTAVDVALSGSFKLGTAFAAGVTTAAGTIVVFDSTGTAYRLLVTNL